MAIVGLTRFLTQSLSMRQENNRRILYVDIRRRRRHVPIMTFFYARSAGFITLAGVFHVPQALVKEETQEDADIAFTQVDIEEQTAGYQAAYSRLAASEAPPTDPTAHIPNPHAYLGQELTRAVREDVNFKSWIGQSKSHDVTKGLLDSLAQIGYVM